MNGLVTFVAILAFAMFVVATAVFLLRLVFVPLALWHQVRQWRRRKAGSDGAYGRGASISVVVPAYNEEPTLANCIYSIANCGYENLEIVIVDDGSSDATEQIGLRLEKELPAVRYIRQANAGKGAALNHGYRESTGEFLMFIDADSVFTKDTVPEMLMSFYNPRVGAVCGDDRPVNLNRVLTRFLALITYVGTGLVRRAFDVMGAMPVVSGNCGAFRRTALDDVARGGPGPLREDTIGEDLEMTWRLHRTDWQVVFAPDAVVYAESPSSFKALWKQRVRWARGLLQSFNWHKDALVKPGEGPFCGLVWFTLVAMIFLPVAQTLSLLAVIGVGLYDWFERVRGGEPVLGPAEASGAELYVNSVWSVIVASGLVMSLVLLVVAMAMGGGLKDLRHLWTAPVWPVYSTVMSLTMIRALYLEIANKPQVWNKPERTGVISVRDTKHTNQSSEAAAAGALEQGIQHGPSSQEELEKAVLEGVVGDRAGGSGGRGGDVVGRARA